MNRFERVVLNAQHIADGISNPVFSRADYEDAMLELAKRATPPGDSTAKTFVRLCEEGNEQIGKLYSAARLVDKQESVTKRYEDPEHDRRMERARKMQQPGESIEQAYLRLLRDEKK